MYLETDAPANIYGSMMAISRCFYHARFVSINRSENSFMFDRCPNVSSSAAVSFRRPLPLCELKEIGSDAR